MAAEGKYHNRCLNEFKRRTNEKSSSAKSEVDAAMEHLIERIAWSCVCFGYGVKNIYRY